MATTGVRSSERLLTAEEFYAEYADQPFELVEGRAVEMPPTSAPHGSVDSRVHVPLATHVRGKSLGEVYPNVGFILRRDPDVVRGPDLAFVSNERARLSPMPETGFWAVAPDLVVEVVSPDDRAEDLMQKLEDYMTAGVRLAWFVYPRHRRVHVFRPGERPEILDEKDTLDGGDVVPGFSLPIRELFG